MSEKRYIVHARAKHPAWNEHGGYQYEVSARNKREANARAREKHKWIDGNFGLWYFTATEEPDPGAP